MPEPSEEELIINELRVAGARMQTRLEAIVERDGSAEAAVTGRGVSISYLLTRDVTRALKSAGDLLEHGHSIEATAKHYPKPAHGWTCFHCGETFHSIGDAQHHFGTSPDDFPSCVMHAWNTKRCRLMLGAKNIVAALRKALSRVRRLEDEVETLTHRIAAAKDGPSRMDWDSMEGRALTAEAIVADMARRVPAMVVASRRRVTDGPRTTENDHG